jgi:hypothetical protein
MPIQNGMFFSANFIEHEPFSQRQMPFDSSGDGLRFMDWLKQIAKIAVPESRIGYGLIHSRPPTTRNANLSLAFRFPQLGTATNVRNLRMREAKNCLGRFSKAVWIFSNSILDFSATS